MCWSVGIVVCRRWRNEYGKCGHCHELRVLRLNFIFLIFTYKKSNILSPVSHTHHVAAMQRKLSLAVKVCHHPTTVLGWNVQSLFLPVLLSRLGPSGSLCEFFRHVRVATTLSHCCPHCKCCCRARSNKNSSPTRICAADGVGEVFCAELRDRQCNHRRRERKQCRLCCSVGGRNDPRLW